MNAQRIAYNSPLYWGAIVRNYSLIFQPLFWLPTLVNTLKNLPKWLTTPNILFVTAT